MVELDAAAWDELGLESAVARARVIGKVRTRVMTGPDTSTHAGAAEEARWAGVRDGPKVEVSAAGPLRMARSYTPGSFSGRPRSVVLRGWPDARGSKRGGVACQVRYLGHAEEELGGRRRAQVILDQVCLSRERGQRPRPQRTLPEVPRYVQRRGAADPHYHWAIPTQRRAADGEHRHSHLLVDVALVYTVSWRDIALNHPVQHRISHPREELSAVWQDDIRCSRYQSSQRLLYLWIQLSLVSDTDPFLQDGAARDAYTTRLDEDPPLSKTIWLLLPVLMFFYMFTKIGRSIVVCTHMAVFGGLMHSTPIAPEKVGDPAAWQLRSTREEADAFVHDVMYKSMYPDDFAESVVKRYTQAAAGRPRTPRLRRLNGSPGSARASGGRRRDDGTAGVARIEQLGGSAQTLVVQADRALTDCAVSEKIP